MMVGAGTTFTFRHTQLLRGELRGRLVREWDPMTGAKQQSRIRHLEKEVQMFRENILKRMGGE
jgi:hypothetical protein